ncbi:MAG: hypothetical protein ACOWWR_16590 [Eubacteriales bacterium]
MCAMLDAGDWAAIVSAVILVLGIIYGWAKSCWNRAHPFTIKVSLDSYESCSKRYSNIAELEISDTQFLIYVSPIKGTSWDRVNIRFVKRKFSPWINRIWKYEDADPDVVGILDFKDVIEERAELTPNPDRYFESNADGVGGHNGDYIPPLYVKGGELVWYEVYARANKFWKGFLSFEGAMDNRRAWVRIKAEVKVAKLIKLDGREVILTKKEWQNFLKRASQPVNKSEKGKA